MDLDLDLLTERVLDEASLERERTRSLERALT